MSHDATPGRLTGRSGVLLSVALFALIGAGCEAIGGGQTLQLDSTEVRLENGARIHDIRVGGAGARDAIEPDTVAARSGDVIRFISADHRTHALAFVEAGLAPEARAFLERTQQLRGPPLVNRDAAWAVSLGDAPPGRYPFVCRTHDAAGVVRVE